MFVVKAVSRSLVAAMRSPCVAPSGTLASGATCSSCTSQQVRHHHPSPFDPKITKGWKAALKVRLNFIVILET